MKNKNILFAAAMIFVLMAAGIANAAIVATDNPLLEFTLSTYDPIPAEPGKTVDVWINVQNSGDGDAKNVKLEFMDTSVFTLVSEEDTIISIPLISAHGDYTAKYRVMVADNAPEGENDILIKYSVGSNGIEVVDRVAIDIKSAETPISIKAAKITPSQLSPGGKATLVIEIENIARSSNIRNVDVALQLATITSGTTIVDLPFVTVNSGNEQTIDRIAPGQSAEFRFDIAAYPDAEAKIYKLPVTIAYYDDTGEQYEKIILVGVEVNAAPDLLVTLESTDLNTKIKSGTVLFNVINKGTTNIKLMTLTLVDNDEYDVISPSNELYLGNIDSDDFETARFNVKTESTEKVNFEVKLTYKDSLNNEFTENYNVEYTLREPAVQKKGSFTWILIVIVVIIAAVFWFRRRNKRRNN
ncbi:MAG: COG1361 S-layer family protein [Candidatus Nanoarchaeia archaeon]